MSETNENAESAPQGVDSADQSDAIVGSRACENADQSNAVVGSQACENPGSAGLESVDSPGDSENADLASDSELAGFGGVGFPREPGSTGAANESGCAGSENPDSPNEADAELIAAVNEALAKVSANADATDNAGSVSDSDSGAKSLPEIVAERTADLQRLQAEYANYKKRVDRDRALARVGGIEAVVLDLLPVLDSIEAAREHDELNGGFKLVADELEKIATKYGLEAYGEVGDGFDPQIHEALMQLPYEGDTTDPVVSAVMQKGFKLNERVLRPARVGVANTE